MALNPELIPQECLGDISWMWLSAMGAQESPSLALKCSFFSFPSNLPTMLFTLLLAFLQGSLSLETNILGKEPILHV